MTGRRCKFEGREKGSELRRRGRKEREGERSGLSRSLSVEFEVESRVFIEI